MIEPAQIDPHHSLTPERPATDQTASRRDASGAARTAAISLRGVVPALDQAQAEMSRSLFRSAKYWRLADGSELRFAPAVAPSESVSLDADGLRIRIQFAPGMAAAAEESLRWTEYIGRSRLLAWSLAHESALVRMSEALRIPLVPVGNDDVQAQASLWLEARIDSAAGDRPTCRATLSLPLSQVARLLEYAQASPAEDVDGSWIPAPVTIELRGPRLAASDWRNLRMGDVIVLGTQNSLPAPTASSSGLAWPLAICAEGWRINGPSTSIPSAYQEIPAMNQPSASEANSSEAAPLMETGLQEQPKAQAPALPVQIDFSIAQVAMNMDELSALQPGYVFSLPTRLEGANVTIRANGREAGRGEVVAVGDTLGVRLLSWS